MMTLHVLHAGDGYTYLTRQVASGDGRRLRGDALTDYYTAAGNPPGRWVGRGMSGMGVEGQVSERQMQALFGRGLHPNTEVLLTEAAASGVPDADARPRTLLGRAFPRVDPLVDTWRGRLAEAFGGFAREHGHRPVDVERDLIRWTLARELFGVRHGRGPVDDAELKAFVAKLSRPPRRPVAGVDLVFTPVKSVSVLWALGDEVVRREIEAAHAAAWQQALSFIEEHAALTRTGKAGVAQVDTLGLVAAAFDHPDSRSGDPNLHTHVAVSSKVQGADGRWRAWDLRVLHALAVAASETYNTAVEDQLRSRLGVRFVERRPRRDRLPVREVVGVPEALLTEFSSRRRQIEVGYEQALNDYRDRHGHDAPKHVQYRMAQEATLARRPEKPGPRPWAQLRQGWRARAAATLSRSADEEEGEGAVDRMLATVLGPASAAAKDLGVAWPGVDGGRWPALAATAVEAVAGERSTWTRWHVRAEVSRLTRSLPVEPTEREALVDAVTALALNRECLRLDPADVNPAPGALRRRDGESVFEVHGATRYTSEKLILAVEQRLLSAAEQRTPASTAEPVFAAAQAMVESERQLVFDADQVGLARAFVCDDRRLVAGVGAAGAGKTTAMRLAAAALALDGRRLVAVAPSARAAAVLSAEIGAPGVTVAKLLHAYDGIAQRPVPADLWLQAGDVLLVDEAGMTSTPALGRLLAIAEQAGAVLRLVGDPMQLSAPEAGGALRLLVGTPAASMMTQVHRFADPKEAAASLELRAGRVTALGFYAGRDRLTEGSRHAMTEDVYQAWLEDADNGLATLMVSASSVEVARLSARARADLVTAGRVTSCGTSLHDGNVAGVGDTIVTRLNQRLLTVNRGRDFVKNGDRWQVRERLPDGALVVEHLEHHGVTRLAAEYVRRHVELGYATTVHRAQGMTVDTTHVMVDRATTREALYVAMTRGALRNSAYVVTDEALDVDLHVPPDPRRDGLELLKTVLARDGAERSATETTRDLRAASESLSTLVPRYLHGLSRALSALGVEDQVRAGLRAAGGQALEERVASCPSWSRLVLVCAVADPAGLVQEAVRSRLVAGPEEIRDLAAVLVWRIRHLDDDPAQAGHDDPDADGLERGP